MKQASNGSAANGQVPLNPNELSETQLTALLRNDEQAALLTGYFGEALYRELRDLAAGPAPPKRPGVRVYLLPGLMGSRLGVSKKSGVESIWLNPPSLEKGELLRLALPAGRRLRALNAMPSTYLKLKLILERAGFDVCLYAYDWRLSIVSLAKNLARDLAADPTADIMIVAHSMGGLVARAALKHPAAQKISRFIQLGTPNQGSFALVQALRAIYPSLHKLAALDPLHDADALVQRVFRTLPGLYEMLPQPAFSNGIDFFDIDAWPKDALLPDPELLSKARRLHSKLAAADARCHAIAGVGQTTLVAVERDNHTFRYRFSAEGDGTVALPLAQWPNATTWYATAAHGELPKDVSVCQAVIDLLQQGTTTILPTSWRNSARLSTTFSEAALRPHLKCKLRWNDLPIAERRNFLEPAISPAFQALCNTAAGDA